MSEEEQKQINKIASKKYREKIKSDPVKYEESRKKAKERYNLYFEKIKNDPIKYQQYLLKERERSKNKRKKIYSNSDLKQKYNEYQKTYAHKNKDNLKNYPSRSSEEWKKRNICRRYNITIEQYNLMLEQQMGLCKICNQQPKKICVDHCHKTGVVRGLLCGTCNTAIGLFKENIETLQNAIKYLQNTNFNKGLKNGIGTDVSISTEQEQA
jgi:hypothetical protein